MFLQPPLAEIAKKLIRNNFQTQNSNLFKIGQNGWKIDQKLFLDIFTHTQNWGRKNVDEKMLTKK